MEEPVPEEGEALVLADDGASPAAGEGEVFVLACPQDRQFAQSSLGSLPGAVVYSGDEMEPAQAKERLAASRQCCVVFSAAGINALQLQLAGVSPARYRARDICTIRDSMEPNAAIVGELYAGQVIDVTDAAVDAAGVTRLFFKDGWVAYKAHLLARLDTDARSSGPAKSAKPRRRRARGRARRHSVSEEGVQGVTMLGGQAAKELGLVEERVFTVGQTHMSKAPNLVQLKVGGMGLTLFDGPNLLESHLYSVIESWEVGQKSKHLSVTKKAGPNSKKKVQIRFQVLGDDGGVIAKLMQDHAISVKKQRKILKKQAKDPDAAALAEDDDDDSDSQDDDAEPEAVDWWELEMRQPQDRLNLIEEPSLRRHFATVKDRTVRFSGTVVEVRKSDGSRQKLVLVVSKRAVYRMVSPVPAYGDWECKGRLLVRRLRELEISTQADDQIVLKYERSDGQRGSRMFEVEEERRDQMVLALKRQFRECTGTDVPVEVSEVALFGGIAGPSPKSIAGSSFTKETYDNPVKKGDESAELCFTTLMGMAAATMQSMDNASSGVQFFSKDDYSQEDKKKFPAAGSYETPAHEYRDFEFTTYAPDVFKRIRELAHITEEQYLAGLTGLTEDQLFAEGAPDFTRDGLPDGATLCPMFTNSKSGAFFFFTTDMCFLIKTVGPDEVKVLRDMLSDYLAHYERNPDSMINKIIGAYSSDLCAEPFIVMMSTFPLNKDIAMHEVYDLKGSMHGREIKEKEKQAKVVIYKDNDFDQNPQRSFKLTNERRTWFLTRLKADVEFLRRHSLIDYSLLVGIHFRDKKSDLSFHDTNCIEAREGVQEVYYVEIIDYLIEYGGKKKLEHKIRGGMVNKLSKKSRDLDFSALSVTEPTEYSERMVHFITEKTPLASMISHRRRSSTLSLAGMMAPGAPPAASPDPASAGRGRSGRGGGMTLPGVDAAAMEQLMLLSSNGAGQESPAEASPVKSDGEESGDEPQDEDDALGAIEEGGEEDGDEEEDNDGDDGDGDGDDDAKHGDEQTDDADLLGEYRIKNPCMLRVGSDIKSAQSVTLDPGDTIEITEVVKLSSGLVRLQCSEGWLSLKPHLVEKVEEEDEEDAVAELQPTPRKMKRPAPSGAGSKSDDRRHSVAVQGKRGGGLLDTEPSGKLDGMEEKMFQVTQTHIKKTSSQIDLKIGGMGLTLFAKGSLLQSFLYQDLTSWSADDGGSTFTINTKMGATYSFGAEGDAIEMATLMQSYAESVHRASAADRATALLGEYRVKSKAILRAAVETKSEQAGTLKPGQIVEVLQTSVNADGVVRMRCAEGWFSNKPHLVEKIDPSSSFELGANSSLGSPRTPGSPKMRRSLSRRASVAVTDVSTVSALQEDLARSLGVAEEKVFEVTQKHIKKAPARVQLKVGGMGVTLFNGPVHLESLLYARVKGWNATREALVIEVKGDPDVTIRTTEAAEIARLMKSHAESVAHVLKNKEGDRGSGSIMEKLQRQDSNGSNGSPQGLALISDEGEVRDSDPSQTASPALSGAETPETQPAAESGGDAGAGDSILDASRDLSPTPRETAPSSSTGADVLIQLYDMVVDLMERDASSVTSIWLGAYVMVEGHGQLLKRYAGTNPFDDQPPFNTPRDGRTVHDIMHRLLDVKGIQVDPRDSEAIGTDLSPHARALARSSSIQDLSLQMLMEGVPPGSSPRHSPSPIPRAIEDSPGRGGLDEMDVLEREMAELNADGAPTAAEVAALRSELAEQAKHHADALAAIKSEYVESQAAASRAQEQIQEEREQRSATTDAHNAQAATEAARMSALEADLVEVKHDRDLARAEAERAAARLAAEAEATMPTTTLDDHAPAQPAGADQLQELAAMRKQRDGLLESTAQQRRELEQARAVSSQQAQQIREMDAVHKAAAAAQSVESSRLRADIAERAEVVAAMAASAALPADDIDEAVRLQQRVRELESQLATGQQVSASATAADASMLTIEVERLQAENVGLGKELATYRSRHAQQCNEHAELLSENSKLHSQLRRHASEQQHTVSELRELRSTYDELVNVTQSMSLRTESAQLPGQDPSWEPTRLDISDGNGFDTVRARAEAVQRQVEALEQEMRDLVIAGPFSPKAQPSSAELAASSTPQLSPLRSPPRALSPEALLGSPSSSSTGNGSAPTAPFELGEFLRKPDIQLEKYESRLRAQGALSVEALLNTSLAQLNEMGMTTVEKLRLRRARNE